MDFGILPPEINSGRLYAGPGPGAMLAAATAWNDLAEQWYSTAVSVWSVVSALASGTWQGPAYASMTAAVTPYVGWMNATAAQAEQTASQLGSAAAAFEAAFAAAVPPPTIAANRSRLMALVATNFFGQNAPAIAATEAEYAEMWAQDAITMYSYASRSASASQLIPFTPPRPIAGPNGPFGQAAAVIQATGTSSATNTQAALSQLTSAIPSALQGLAGPLQSVSSAPGLMGILQGLTSPQSYLSPAISSAALGTTSGSWASASHADSEIINTQDQIAGTEARIMARLNQITARTVAGWAGSAPPSAATSPAIAADLGGATTVGRLSVPEGWIAAVPPIRLASAPLPTTGADAVSAVPGGGFANPLSNMMLATMATRAMGGTDLQTRPTVIPHSPAAG